MVFRLFFLLSFSLLTLTANSQWVTKASFPGIARAKACSFTINNKLYVLGGVTNGSVVLGDFWEYDMTANSWLQLAPFPGPPRYGATSFVIANKAYITTGGNDFGYLDDIWEYDPATNLWVEKNDMPATTAQRENRRVEAFAFSIGGTGFIGGGTGHVHMPNQTVNIAFFDLWAYNPVSDSWTACADIPDFLGRNMGIGVGLNGRGYVGLGCDVNQTTNRTSFWEYNPFNDSWIAKANFPTNFTADPATFVLNSQIYVAGGVSMTSLSLSSQIYRYDPVNDTWNAMPPFNGGAIAGQVAGTGSNSAFMGGGYNGNIVTRNDYWEYSLSTGLDNVNHSFTRFYPNPASSTLQLVSDKTIEKLEIFNAAGQLQQTFEFHPMSLDVAHYQSGLYQVRMLYKDGTSGISRFIKN